MKTTYQNSIIHRLKLLLCASSFVLVLSSCGSAVQSQLPPGYKPTIPAQLKTKPAPISPDIEKTLYTSQPEVKK